MMEVPLRGFNSILVEYNFWLHFDAALRRIELSFRNFTVATETPDE